MALGPKLDLRQSQSLVMTPQLQQAIKLLQMSNLELNTYVEQELEQNPLLEFDETDGGLDSPADAPTGKHGTLRQVKTVQPATDRATMRRKFLNPPSWPRPRRCSRENRRRSTPITKTSGNPTLRPMAGFRVVVTPANGRHGATRLTWTTQILTVLPRAMLRCVDIYKVR